MAFIRKAGYSARELVPAIAWIGDKSGKGQEGSMAGKPQSDATQLLRTVWARGADEIPVPVDPFVIAQRLGIKAYSADLDEGVSGMLIQRAGQDPEIYVQASDSPNRQRFTCAHELGHYFKHSEAGEAALEFVERRDLLTSQGTDPEEIYANQFAASLLMPEDAVKAESKKLGSAALAYRFGVSADAMNYRLVNLRLK